MEAYSVNNALFILDRNYRKLELFLAIIAGIIVIAMVMIQSSSIISRLLFSAPFDITFDLIRLLFIASLFLGVSYVQSLKGHVGIEIVIEKFPKIVQKYTAIFGYLLAIFIIGLISWQTLLVALESFNTKDYTMGLAHIQFWPFKLSVSLGLFVLLGRLVIDLALNIFAYEDRNKNMVIFEEEEGL